MTARHFLSLLVLVSLTAAPLRAQVAWDSPILVAPSSPTGWGAFMIDPSPGDGVGFVGTWRQTPSLGYRVGVAEAPADEVAIFGGVDLSGRLLSADDQLPFDVSWVVGAGLGLGDYLLLSFPVGLTFGRLLEREDLLVNPYFTPRLVIDAAIGDARPGEDLDLGVAIDVGLDVSPAVLWTVRFGGTIGDREALAIGVSVRP